MKKMMACSFLDCQRKLYLRVIFRPLRAGIDAGRSAAIGIVR
jgi:hypothetical protein